MHRGSVSPENILLELWSEGARVATMHQVPEEAVIEQEVQWPELPELLPTNCTFDVVPPPPVLLLHLN